LNEKYVDDNKAKKAKEAKEAKEAFL